MKILHYGSFAICLLVATVFSNCRRPSVDLDGKGCDTAGRCAPGYVCYPPTFTCVRELPASCDGTGTCPDQIITGGACSDAGAVLPCSTTSTGCDAGCRRCEDGFWSGCSGSVASPTGATGPTGIPPPTGPTGELADPRVFLLTATSGEDSTVSITFDVPNTALACVVRRTTMAAATSATDGTAVGSEITSEPVALQDAGLTNNTPYFYTAFCRAAATYQTVVVSLGENAVQAIPIGLVQNLTATTTAGPSVTLSFAKPSGATACQIKRATGGTPTLATGTNIGAEQTASTPSVVDTSVSNGTTYSYAAFCRVDASYRNGVSELGHNAVVVTVAATCLGTFTVSKTPPAPGDPKQCAPITTSRNDNTIARLTMVSGNCSSHLTGLSVSLHPESSTNFTNVRRTSLTSARLGEDTNSNGLLDDAEVLAFAVVSDTALDFSFFSHAFAANETKKMIVEFDARGNSNFIKTGYFAAQIASASDLSLAEATMTPVLSPAPVVFDAHAVTLTSCASRLSSPMKSVRSFEMTASNPLNLLAPDTLVSGADVNAYCNTHDARCDSDGTQTSNCRANDNKADDLALRTDALGATPSTISRYLKIDTGLPLGLPVCRVALQVQSSLHAGGNNCAPSAPSGALFHWSGASPPAQTYGSPLHYFYKYANATDVAGPIGTYIDVRLPVIFTTETTASPSGTECMHMDVTHTLTSLYQLDVATTDTVGATFVVRMFADQSPGLDDAATASVRNASEVHLFINEP